LRLDDAMTTYYELPSRIFFFFFSILGVSISFFKLFLSRLPHGFLVEDRAMTFMIHASLHPPALHRFPIAWHFSTTYLFFPHRIIQCISHDRIPLLPAYIFACLHAFSHPSSCSLHTFPISCPTPPSIHPIRLPPFSHPTFLYPSLLLFPHFIFLFLCSLTLHSTLIYLVPFAQKWRADEVQQHLLYTRFLFSLSAF